jgi:hypothetical protein
MICIILFNIVGSYPAFIISQYFIYSEISGVLDKSKGIEKLMILNENKSQINWRSKNEIIFNNSFYD